MLGPRQRVVLAMLAMRASRLVTRDELIDGVWGERPPKSVVNRVHVLISSLRAVLEPGRQKRATGRILQSVASGYRLLLTGGQTDAAVFEDLLLQARTLAGEDRLADAAAVLDTAFGLWRGTPMAGLPGPWAQAQRVRLEQLRLAAVEHQAELLLASGEPADLVARLATLRDENPMRERTAALLMTALCRTGRRAEALEIYADTRQLLVDQLGVEPGAQLRQTHLAILRDDHTQPASSSQVPAQLPLGVFGFTGRRAQLDQLDKLSSLAAGNPTAVIIAVISGTAGIGKTALALQWAHQAAHRFPDGQLYANLRGFDPYGKPVPADEALRRFLTALGLPAGRIPADQVSLVALYRSTVARKKILVLLDNARDAEQVRPLLPGAGGCMVIATSRETLSGLIATEAAFPLRLDPLTLQDGQDLLAHRLGQHRVWAEPDSVREILTLCARLPLAVATIAAQAASRPGIALSVLAAELSEASSRLDVLDGNDPATNIRSTLSWSYHALDSEPARLFRLTALHPGPFLTASAAASLTGRSLARTQTMLARLLEANLLTEHLAGQYAIHDLLRAYAAELTETLDTSAERAAATRRTLDHYLHTAQAAACLLEPHREKLSLPRPEPDVHQIVLKSLSDALSWLDTEHLTLVTIVHQAADAGLARHAWQLAHNLNTYFNRQGHWHDQIATQNASLHATIHTADKTGQAHAHSGLARALFRLSRHDEAHYHLRQALDLYQELHDPLGQARAHIGLAFRLTHIGRCRDSLDHLQRALTLFADTGHTAWYAQTLNDLGWSHALLGEYENAITHCRRALSLMEQLDDPHSQANTHDSLGYAHHHLGNHRQAVEHYQHAARLFRQCGERYLEAETLIRHGETLLAMQDHSSARAKWESALKILDGVGHPDNTTIRERLRGIFPVK